MGFWGFGALGDEMSHEGHREVPTQEGQRLIPVRLEQAPDQNSRRQLHAEAPLSFVNTYSMLAISGWSVARLR